MSVYESTYVCTRLYNSYMKIYVYAYVCCAFVCLSIYVSTSASCSLTYSHAPHTAPSTHGSLQLSTICIDVYIHITLCFMCMSVLPITMDMSHVCA